VKRPGLEICIQNCVGTPELLASQPTARTRLLRNYERRTQSADAFLFFFSFSSESDAAAVGVAKLPVSRAHDAGRCRCGAERRQASRLVQLPAQRLLGHDGARQPGGGVQHFHGQQHHIDTGWRCPGECSCCVDAARELVPKVTVWLTRSPPWSFGNLM